MYRFGGHFALDERPLFVLGLSAAEGCLQGHDPLPFSGEAALFAVAIAELTVALVPLQPNFETVVTAAGTVRRRPRVQRVAAGRTAAVPPALVPRFGHRLHPAI